MAELAYIREPLDYEREVEDDPEIVRISVECEEA